MFFLSLLQAIQKSHNITMQGRKKSNREKGLKKVYKHVYAVSFLRLFKTGCGEYIEYIRIFSDTNIRSYHIRNICLLRIYSDIRSYQNFDTNIFVYSFVSNNFIQIHSDIRSYQNPYECHTLPWTPFERP